MKGSLLLLALFIGIFLSASVVQSAKRHRLHFPRHAALSVKAPGWGIDAEGNVFALNPTNQLIKVPGKTLIYVDVGVFYGELHAFGIDRYYDIYHRVGESGRWTYLPGKKLRFLRIQGPNRIWGLNVENQIFTVNVTTQEWKQIPGTLKYLDIHPTGRIWGINHQKQIFTRSPDGGSLVQVPGALTKLRVLRDGRVFGIDDHTLYWREGAEGKWIHIDGFFQNIDATIINNKLSIWGVGSDWTIWYNDKVVPNWGKLPGFLTRFRILDNGKIFGIDERNKKTYIGDIASNGLTQISGVKLVSLFGPDGK